MTRPSTDNKHRHVSSSSDIPGGLPALQCRNTNVPTDTDGDANTNTNTNAGIGTDVILLCPRILTANVHADIDPYNCSNVHANALTNAHPGTRTDPGTGVDAMPKVIPIANANTKAYAETIVILIYIN